MNGGSESMNDEIQTQKGVQIEFKMSLTLFHNPSWWYCHVSLCESLLAHISSNTWLLLHYSGCFPVQPIIMVQAWTAIPSVYSLLCAPSSAVADLGF